MNSQTLSTEAMNIIDHYTNLTFGDKQVACPYYNNRRQAVRGALRATIGKGSPEEIIEEATIMALREKVRLPELSTDDITKFLVDHTLGIDCSALAYYILDSELLARKKTHLKQVLHFPYAKNIVRKWLTKLRPVENTNTKTLAHDTNSHVVQKLNDIKPGDMIILLNAGRDHDRDHVMIIHEIECPPLLGKEGRGVVDSIIQQKIIHYTHALQWRTDGKYRHGVRQGTIEITDPSKPIIEQRWTEQGLEGLENGTLEHAHEAETLAIRRLRALDM